MAKCSRWQERRRRTTSWSKFFRRTRFTDEQRDTLLNPILLAEALSPSTEAYERGRKFEHYKTIDSLREYLLIATDRVHGDLYTRQEDGRWLLTSPDGPDRQDAARAR